MVVKSANNTSSDAYVNTSSSFKSVDSSSNNDGNLASVVQKYDKFLRSFDGSANVASSTEGLMDELFDPDFTIVADGEERDLEFFKYTILGLASAQHRTRDVEVSVVGGDTIRITFDVVFSDGDSCRVDRIVTARNGKVVHSRPVDGDTFAEYKKYVPIEQVAAKYKNFVESSFAGASRDDIEAAMDEVFSPDFVIIAGGKEKDLDFFKNMIVAAAKSPLTSRINTINILDRNHIQVNFSLLVAGLSLFSVDRRLTVEGDRIVRFEPSPGHRDVFNEVKSYLFPFGSSASDASTDA